MNQKKDTSDKDNNQTDKRKDNTTKFKSIDIKSLQEDTLKKGVQGNLSSPAAPNSFNPPEPPKYQGTPNQSINQEQEQYILAVKKIIFDFLAAFQEGTITFTEKSKQKQKTERIFTLNKKKVDLEIIENRQSTHYVYHINTGLYLKNNIEEDFYAAQDFVQTVLQPTFKWIADDKAVYTLKRTPRI
mgnify:CR=1 FL=1